MAKVSIDAAETLLSLLCSSQGFSAAMAEIQMRDTRSVPELGESQMLPGHVSGDLAEEGRGFQYPALFVYCDKVTNSHREKFRKFSGKARLNIEIKSSQSRLEVAMVDEVAAEAMIAIGVGDQNRLVA